MALRGSSLICVTEYTAMREPIVDVIRIRTRAKVSISSSPSPDAGAKAMAPHQCQLAYGERCYKGAACPPAQVEERQCQSGAQHLRRRYYPPGHEKGDGPEALASHLHEQYKGSDGRYRAGSSHYVALDPPRARDQAGDRSRQGTQDEQYDGDLCGDHVNTIVCLV